MCCSALAKQGFATIPDVFASAEVQRLREGLAHMTLRRSRAGVRHALRDAAVAALAHDPKLVRIAQEVLGPGAFPFRVTLFDKSPDANWLVVWHQDTALPLCERRDLPGWGPWSVKEGVIYAHAPTSALSQVLALRLHLDDSLASNGPLRVLPGTHTQGVLTDEAVYQLAQETPAVECLVRQDGVLAMRPMIVHCSSKSQATAAPRRVLHIEFASTAMIADGLELAIA